MITRAGRRTGALLAAVAGLLLSVGSVAAHAAGDATIDHSEHAEGVVRLLVSVGSSDEVDLDSVEVTVDGEPAAAEAEPAASSDVRRTTVLAIDTSNSMAGRRIAEARKAALTYLETVPANVEIGIVTFDDDVVVRQEPSRDRAASRAVIEDLALNLNTSLYEGVETAVATAGDSVGQRQVLVLSDGLDNTDAELAPVVEAITRANVKVDVVALEQGAEPPAPLQDMADAGNGTVVSASDPEALSAAFSDEAGTLARQVVVTAQVPTAVTATDATVQVSLDAGGSTHTASAFVAVGEAAPATASLGEVPSSNPGGPRVSQTLMYVAVFAIGIALLGVFYVLVGTKPAEEKLPLADQLQLYTATEPATRPTRTQTRSDQDAARALAAQAREAAASVLSSNKSLEEKIALRLEGAGMALKSSEWLLMHLAIAFGSGVVGILLTAGNPLGLLLFGALGAVGPWIYLGLRRSRRLKAFAASLADTLQLMSGSLSAGLSLAQSMDTIVREGTEPITSEFKRAIVESRLGVPLEDALEGIADRMQSRDFKWVVMAIRIQREVGGNLAELLLSVAGTLREREYLRRHVRALSAEGRLSCWILGGLPPGFLAYLTLSKPDYVHPMYTTPIGWLMCAGMAILLGVGIFWMSKLAKVEV